MEANREIFKLANRFKDCLGCLVLIFFVNYNILFFFFFFKYCKCFLNEIWTLMTFINTICNARDNKPKLVLQTSLLNKKCWVTEVRKIWKSNNQSNYISTEIFILEFPNYITLRIYLTLPDPLPDNDRKLS